MATTDEIQQILDLLIEEYKADLSETKIAMLFDAWAEVDARDLRRAALRHMKRCEFFPRLSEMNELIADEREARRSHISIVASDDDLAREVQEYERICAEEREQEAWPKCEPCDDAGYVVRMPDGEVVTLTCWRFQTGQSVPCGEPTQECPWEKCAHCDGLGKQVPEESEVVTDPGVEDATVALRPAVFQHGAVRSA